MYPIRRFPNQVQFGIALMSRSDLHPSQLIEVGKSVLCDVFFSSLTIDLTWALRSVSLYCCCISPVFIHFFFLFGRNIRIATADHACVLYLFELTFFLIKVIQKNQVQFDKMKVSICWRHFKNLEALRPSTFRLEESEIQSVKNLSKMKSKTSKSREGTKRRRKRLLIDVVTLMCLCLSTGSIELNWRISWMICLMGASFSICFDRWDFSSVLETL